jgi:hypothetical protein
MVVHPFAVFEGGHLMFDHYCTTCAKRQLIFPSQVSSMTNTDRGIVVAFTCWCGADQTMVTGRAATEASSVTLAA